MLFSVSEVRELLKLRIGDKLLWSLEGSKVKKGRKQDMLLGEIKMRNRIWKIPLWLIFVIAGVTIATAYVMYSLRIPSTIVILPPEEDSYQVGVYEDALCTTEITHFDFGAVRLGHNSSVHFYVKSLSSVPIEVRVRVVASGWVDPEGPPPFMHNPYLNGGSDTLIMAPGEIRECTYTLVIPFIGNDPGTYNFDLVFNVYPTA